MFAVGLRPTGSKDPFALRRAGLGIIRLILENGLRVPLRRLFLAVPPPAARPDAAVDADLASAACSTSSPTGSRCICANAVCATI